MSSTTPLTDSINNLTTYANSVTGASDTNLSDAVATLASGYGGGGSDLSWLASATPVPSVRNFFYALSNGNVEHGEVSFTSTPTKFIDVFTLTNITEPQGIIFIDKDFYQGVSGLPNQSSDAVGFCWVDKSFTNPASDASLKYFGFNVKVTQTATSVGVAVNSGTMILDGESSTWRAKYQFSGKTFQIKHDYGNNDQYCFFLRNRTYIWIAY